MHIFNLFTGECNIIDRENSYFSQEQWFEVKAVMMGLLQTRSLWITYINGGLFWCFYQLFGLILLAPIHCRGSIGKQVM